MNKFFHDRVVYRNKEQAEAMKCEVCGSAPVIEWDQDYYASQDGWVIMFPHQLRCPNGSHEATFEEFLNWKRSNFPVVITSNDIKGAQTKSWIKWAK